MSKTFIRNLIGNFNQKNKQKINKCLENVETISTPAVDVKSVSDNSLNSNPNYQSTQMNSIEINDVKISNKNIEESSNKQQNENNLTNSGNLRSSLRYQLSATPLVFIPPPVSVVKAAASAGNGNNNLLSAAVIHASNHVIPTSTPQMLRKILPLTTFIVTFITVMITLFVYMDNTAIRHHQFQINMTQDYDLVGVQQDNPELIAYIQFALLRQAIEPYSTNSPHDMMHKVLNSQNNTKASELEKLVAKILNYKTNGIFIETNAYRHGQFSNTEWLEKNLSWTGLLVQWVPRDFFDLLKRGRNNSKAIHACLSTQPHPKEITIPLDYPNGVKVSSIHMNSVFSDDDPDFFNTRVKCFPLFSLMLAINRTTIDVLILEADCNEYDVLNTLPFDRINVNVIAVHYKECELEQSNNFTTLNGKTEDDSKFNRTDDTSPINLIMYSHEHHQPSVNHLKRHMASLNYKFLERIGDDFVFLLNKY